MPATTQKTAVRTIRTDRIVGQAAIAARFGISAQAVWNWTQRPDFPQPLPGTDCGRPIWDLDEITEWEKNWVRSKGGYHTHKQNGQGPPRRRRGRRQWKEGDPQ